MITRSKRCAYIHQAETRRRLLRLQSQAGMKSSRSAPGVHKELVHVLKGIEAVGAAPAEHVDVEAVGLGEEQVGLGGDEGEALEEADADAAVLDDVGDGQRGGLDVVAALDDLEVGRDGAQVLVRVLVGQVAEAERLGDLARGEELLELGSARWLAHMYWVWVAGDGASRAYTLAGTSRARSGMCRSPMTRMRNAMVCRSGDVGGRD